MSNLAVTVRIETAVKNTIFYLWVMSNLAVTVRIETAVKITIFYLWIMLDIYLSSSS